MLSALHIRFRNYSNGLSGSVKEKLNSLQRGKNGREGEPTSMNDDSKRAKESHPHAQGHDEKATLLKYIREV